MHGGIAPQLIIFVGGHEPAWGIWVGIVAAIILAVMWIMGRVRNAQEAERRRAATRPGETIGTSPENQPAPAVAREPEPTPTAPPAPTVTAAASGGPDPRTLAWAHLHDPATDPARLAQIAGDYPEFAESVATHAQAYPELKAWAATVLQGPSATTGEDHR